MDEQIEAARIENYSLDDVIGLLLSATPISRAKGQPDFRLDSADSLKAFAFYARNRELWPRSRPVQAKELNNLLLALEGKVSDAPRATGRREESKPIWHLRRIEAHRFAGLHRHCATDGSDPEPFVLEFDKDITLISGFNGAGKTALLSAVTWCLTGKALRSQHMPVAIHEPMLVQRTGPDEEVIEPEEDGADISVPPIVPIPSGANLEALGDRPKLDTWVRLTFRREDNGESRSVTRELLAPLGHRITAPAQGIEELGLSALALEVGTLMPGVAAHMRFDEKTDFTQAIAQLTGLKPLEDLGKRAQRIVTRLRKDEKQATEDARTEKARTFGTAKQAVLDAWKAQDDLGDPSELLLPGELKNAVDCAASIAAARTGLEQAQRDLAGAVETILGRRLELANKQDVDGMQRMLDDAADQLKGGALGGLPSIGTIRDLGAIPEPDMAATQTLIGDIHRRARNLATRLEDERQATRWRLYARVAAWHREHHPETDIVNCPVCDTDLKDVPADALLNLSVKEALNRCRQVDADIAKTATEWERDEAASFLNALPRSVRGFADQELPATLLQLYRKGFVSELLTGRAFSGRLQSLQNNGKALWDIAEREHPLPEAAEQSEESLPGILAAGTLEARLSKVTHALNLATHRNRNKEALAALATRYIGAPKSADGESQAPTIEKEPQEASLREQIDIVRRAVRNAAPIVSLIRQLDELDRARQAWETEDKRLVLLERAAEAVEPFLEFPELVYEQVSGLILALDRGIGAWLKRLYRPHYLDGPDYCGFDPTQENGVGLRAGIGDMRVPAHQVMNASLLRACVWAFLFSLWEHVRTQAGGLSCILLDDPQTHFDPINSDNLAASVPAMHACGMRPIIASNDGRFVASVEDKLPKRARDSPSWTALQLDPISSSKLTASLSPTVEEIRERRDRWREDRNSAPKAQDFVERVRIDAENRLWNLLATDPLVMHSPTLAQLLNQLRGARSRGERPFDEQPFEKLLDHPQLRDSAPFYQTINKAHHRLADVTPYDADEVDKVFESIESLLRSCTASYARFMGRLTREDSALFELDLPALPEPTALPDTEIPVLGQLSARSSSNSLAMTAECETMILNAIGSIAMFALRGPTLGSLALRGQVVLAALDREASEGDPVIALCGDKVYARRLHKDSRDPSRMTLVPDRSGTERVPPAIVLPSARTRVMPIVGILYDRLLPDGCDEAVPVLSSDILSRRLQSAHIVDDSAYPVIRDGDMVLMEPLDDLSAEHLEALEGRIVAVVAGTSGEGFGFLKRMGPEVAPKVRILENIGLNGNAICIGINADPLLMPAQALDLDRLWRVHGVLRLGSR